MRSPIRQLIVLCVLAAVISGCSKGGSNSPVVVPDTTKPTIVIAAPTAGQIFSAGNNIPFQVTFSDNEALKSYDAAISQNLLGGLILKVVPTSVPFTYAKSTTTLTGKSSVITLSDINIPVNSLEKIVTTGSYNLKVTCTDSSNNTTSTTLIINIH
jgi:Domain of unknown function (DUF4625)